LRVCLLCAEVLQVKEGEKAWFGTLFAAFSEASKAFCDGD
jgi:hypothetical protein